MKKHSDLKNNDSYAVSKQRMIVLFLIIYDVAVFVGSYFLALWIRFDCHYTEIPNYYINTWMEFAPFYAAAGVLVFLLFKLYQSVWRFASFTELKRTVLATLIMAVLHVVGTVLFLKRMPVSYYIGGAAFQLIFTLLVRFAYRFITLEKGRKLNERSKEYAARVMLIGAGDAGRMILHDLHSGDNLNDCVCCIIDDDRSKWGCFIDGVRIVGGRDDIMMNVEKYRIDKIYLAIPSATPEQRRDILNICQETDCELKNLPGIYQFVSGKVTAKSMKNVDVEDLLGRQAVKVDMQEIYDFIKGKTILVTGGGGSIGSELCRQIASHEPKKLIVFDIYENNAHAIQLELEDKYPGLNFEILIGSVRDSRRIEQVFRKYKPDVVYHAAAHKHVPLMEGSPCEAIKNNAIGTYKTAYAALMNGCKRFVLISTDKAVNPTNVMGASKRICEMIIQAFDRKIKEGRYNEIVPLYVHNNEDENAEKTAKLSEQPKTEFVAVRFGNVLGSNGSVIPRFKEQIAAGGPVTVTHPDIIRFFMTIPEAASLVLQAGTYAKGGEIFVLDMGEPVKIDTLARNLIRLCGFRPGVDIEIEYTGLRPGEKLYEERLMSEEGLKTTANHLIHIGQPIPFDTDAFLNSLPILMEAAYSGREDDTRRLIAEVVTTYHPAAEGNPDDDWAKEHKMQFGAEPSFF